MERKEKPRGKESHPLRIDAGSHELANAGAKVRDTSKMEFISEAVKRYIRSNEDLNG